ncbi:MAG: flavin reductase family protein [Pyrinomonadaceae bacterium]
MAVSEDEFRNALSCFASGVNVVTTIDAVGNLHGLTVSAFCSVSLSPPLILICIEKSTASHYAFQESKGFVVNVLNESQALISELFATPLDDKFRDVKFSSSVDGFPVLSDTLAHLECRIVKTLDGGDHSIFLGEVENVVVKNGDPLLYFKGQYRSFNG